VPGLGTSFGRGGATTFSVDVQHSDSILIMGSNMAECHPVAFRWVMQAKTRDRNPATVIHADPRFTRTSAMANIYAPVRAGSDIVFLGALVRFVLEKHSKLVGKKREDLRAARDRFFFDYLTRYTNALTLINKDFQDTEDLAGKFSGLADDGKYDLDSWRYEGFPPKKGAARVEGEPASFTELVGKLVGRAPQLAESLADPHCVFQILRKHYARYTPEMVADVCGTPPDRFREVAEAVYGNAGPDRTGAICYAVGWTQHTTGVQMIRTAAILQLLLGNIGRPGGGILALRGHATIQGSTDIATLYNIHPGYLNTPDARKKHDSINDYLRAETDATSYWSNMPAFLVSQLKAWFGDAATKQNEFGYGYLPRIVGDHSHIPMFVEMGKGNVKGFFAMGQNPAVGGQNASFQRQALANLDWLVVRDLYETETATFWRDSPEVKSGALKPEEIDTEVFLLPAAAVAEGDGSFTNTHRLVQFHGKAVDPTGDRRTDLWFTVHLGLLLKDLYKKKLERLRKEEPKQAKAAEENDWAIHALTWDYINAKENEKWEIKDEPSARLVLKEINGYYTLQPTGAAGIVAAAAAADAPALLSAAATTTMLQGLKTARPLKVLADIKDDGSTACGAWIYTGVFAPTDDEPLGHNYAANRKGDGWVSQEWGFSWPANRRILYNRCSADPDGRPWAKEARLAGQFAPRLRGNQRFKVDDQVLRAGDRLPGYVLWGAEWDPKTEKWVDKWLGLDVPDFVLNKAPGTKGKAGAVGLAGHDADSPFIMKPDGKGWLFVPTGLVDGPMPTHYEPAESPVKNLVYRQQQNNPVVLRWDARLGKSEPLNPIADIADPKYPHILSTYRLTEHHLSGSMSRWLPWLVELMPELFCEISPEHADMIGVKNTDFVRITTPRGSIRAKALVTRRIRPFHLKDEKDKERVVHHVGLPWHWGYKGLSKGDVVNDLSALVGDPNVSIHEAKVFVCDVTRG
jgi:formate dehydrogenase major subunit